MATLECDRYHLSFFGYQSMQNHYVYGSTDGKKKQPRQEDPRLSDPTQMQELPRTAPTCKEYKNLRLYQCYIQNPTELEEKLKRRKKLKRKVNGSQNLETKDPLFV